LGYFPVWAFRHAPAGWAFGVRVHTVNVPVTSRLWPRRRTYQRTSHHRFIGTDTDDMKISPIDCHTEACSPESVHDGGQLSHDTTSAASHMGAPPARHL
jgi:hypothetical protein